MNPIIGGVLGFLGKRSDRKAAKDAIAGKVALAKEQGKQHVDVTTAEWEAVVARGMDSSWKDEYLTVLLSLPIAVCCVGAFYAPALDAGRDMLLTFKEAGLQYNMLFMLAVSASFGVKVLR